MTDNWMVMNDVREAFDQIAALCFLLEQLQEAVDSNNNSKVVDISHALTAFLPTYCDNFDKKFKVAWEHFVSKPTTAIQ